MNRGRTRPRVTAIANGVAVAAVLTAMSPWGRQGASRPHVVVAFDVSASVLESGGDPSSSSDALGARFGDADPHTTIDLLAFATTARRWATGESPASVAEALRRPPPAVDPWASRPGAAITAAGVGGPSVEQVEGLVEHPVRARAVAVHLVDHDDRREAARECLLRDEACLRHRSLDRVDQQQQVVAGGGDPTSCRPDPPHRMEPGCARVRSRVGRGSGPAGAHARRIAAQRLAAGLADAPAALDGVAGAGRDGGDDGSAPATWAAASPRRWRPRAFQVVLVDLDDEKVARGISGSSTETLAQAGVERKIFKSRPVEQLKSCESHPGHRRLERAGRLRSRRRGGLRGSGGQAQVFERLDEVCRPDAILATNTSSLSVTGSPRRPHPNASRAALLLSSGQEPPGRGRPRRGRPMPALLTRRLVAAGTDGQDADRLADASASWSTASSCPGSTRRCACSTRASPTSPRSRQACKKTFGVGMGPFELMNVTGVPIALHAATTLGGSSARCTRPADGARAPGRVGRAWPLEGEADESKLDVCRRAHARRRVLRRRGAGRRAGGHDRGHRHRRAGRPALAAGAVPDDESVGVGRGPRSSKNSPSAGTSSRRVLARARGRAGNRFTSVWSRRAVADGVATLTINRPDAMNALNEEVVEQLHDAFRQAAADPAVRGIVIAGAGKAFIAGADIRFFVRNIDAGNSIASSSSPAPGTRCSATSTAAPSPSSPGCTVWPWAAGSSWRWPATRSSPRPRPPSPSRDGYRHLPRAGRHAARCRGASASAWPSG